jgi:hypothetical protein
MTTPRTGSMMLPVFAAALVVWIGSWGSHSGLALAQQSPKNEKDLDPLAQQELNALWEALASPGKQKAEDAIASFLKTPDRTLLFLVQRLQPATNDPEKLAQWIKDLDADDFQVREKASAELAKLRELAESSLQKTLQNTSSVEVKKRAERLLGALGGTVAESTADEKRVAALIKDLDDANFATRETASRELEAIGKGAEPALKEVMERAISLDLRRRVERLLQKLSTRSDLPMIHPERLRIQRAVTLLGRLAVPDAKKHLAALAGGAPEAWLTQEARKVLNEKK